MSLASFGFAGFLANALGLLDEIEPEILINKIEGSKAELDSDCLPSGKYKISGPFPTDVFIEFYLEDQTPYVLIQGLLYELIPLKNCEFLGFSKAIFFPGAPIAHFVVEDKIVNMIMDNNKRPLTKIIE